MKTLTNLALAPVRLTIAVLTAAVTDRLDALAHDNNDTADVLSELIERVEDIEKCWVVPTQDDHDLYMALARVRTRAQIDRDSQQVIA